MLFSPLNLKHLVHIKCVAQILLFLHIWKNYFMCTNILSACVSIQHMCTLFHKGWKWVSDPLELELQVIQQARAGDQALAVTLGEQLVLFAVEPPPQPFVHCLCSFKKVSFSLEYCAPSVLLSNYWSFYTKEERLPNILKWWWHLL